MSEHGGTHSYLIEERIGFTKVINDVLKDDESLAGMIPINPENDDIFSSMDAVRHGCPARTIPSSI